MQLSEIIIGAKYTRIERETFVRSTRDGGVYHLLPGETIVAEQVTEDMVLPHGMWEMHLAPAFLAPAEPDAAVKVWTPDPVTYAAPAKKLDAEPAPEPASPQVAFSGTKDVFPTGATRDAGKGKGRFDLVPFEAVTRVAVVYEQGANIHGANNWKKGITFSRCMSAALRHIGKWAIGMRDEDHLAQAVWNILAIMYFEEQKRTAELDDVRPGAST